MNKSFTTIKNINSIISLPHNYNCELKFYITLSFIILLLSGIVFTFSCTKKERVLTDQELFNKGTELINKEKFRNAEEYFNRIEEEYPDSPLIANARLNKADCKIKLKEFDLARDEYVHFINMHPLHPKADIARYRIALTYYNQILSTDRDQTFTINAIEEFERYLKEYPQSPLVPEVKEMITDCRKNLMEHDFYIVRFYLKTGAYKAARERLQEMNLLYPESGRKDEILYLIYKTYLKEGMSDEAKFVSLSLCKDYPHSPFTRDIESICKKNITQDLFQ